MNLDIYLDIDIKRMLTWMKEWERNPLLETIQLVDKLSKRVKLKLEKMLVQGH